MSFTEPFPSRDAIVKKSRKATDVFTRWNEESLQQRINQTPYRPQPSDVITGIAATESGTLGGDVASGLYRVTYAAFVAVAEALATLTLTLNWTQGGIVRSHVFAALNGAVAAGEQGFVYPVWTDPGTPISYSLAYVGVAFRADAVLSAELVQTIEEG